MKTKTTYTLPLFGAILLSMSTCSDEKGAADAGGDAGGKGDGYPLKVCVVSGEELGSMGKPVEYDHEGTMVKFCCKSCIPKFEKDPAAYLAKLKPAAN